MVGLRFFFCEKRGLSDWSRFDQESPDWADDDGGSGEEKPERILTGETGVQDF